MTIIRRMAALAMAGSLAALALATVPTAGAIPGTTPAPHGFIANAISWISPTQGWVLGAAPCSAGTCADVLGTTDAGSSWHLVGSIAGGLPAPQQSGATGVSEIRFATAKVGFAYGPDLWRTADGGKTWSKLVASG